MTFSLDIALYFWLVTSHQFEFFPLALVLPSIFDSHYSNQNHFLLTIACSMELNPSSAPSSTTSRRRLPYGQGQERKGYA
jgi:hypothetical protein